jgi:hypothetical protein
VVQENNHQPDNGLDYRSWVLRETPNGFELTNTTTHEVRRFGKSDLPPELRDLISALSAETPKAGPRPNQPARKGRAKRPRATPSASRVGDPVTEFVLALLLPELGLL